jgi:hypothetical protein
VGSKAAAGPWSAAGAINLASGLPPPFKALEPAKEAANVLRQPCDRDMAGRMAQRGAEALQKVELSNLAAYLRFFSTGAAILVLWLGADRLRFKAANWGTSTVPMSVADRSKATRAGGVAVTVADNRNPRRPRLRLKERSEACAPVAALLGPS